MMKSNAAFARKAAKESAVYQARKFLKLCIQCGSKRDTKDNVRCSRCKLDQRRRTKRRYDANKELLLKAKLEGWWVCKECSRHYSPKAAENVNYECEDCLLPLFDSDGEQLRSPESVLPGEY